MTGNPTWFNGKYVRSRQQTLFSSVQKSLPPGRAPVPSSRLILLDLTFCVNIFLQGFSDFPRSAASLETVNTTIPWRCFQNARVITCLLFLFWPIVLEIDQKRILWNKTFLSLNVEFAFSRSRTVRRQTFANFRRRRPSTAKFMKFSTRSDSATTSVSLPSLLMFSFNLIFIEIGSHAKKPRFFKGKIMKIQGLEI